MRKLNKNIRKIKKHSRGVNYNRINDKTLYMGFQLTNRIIRNNKIAKIKIGLKNELTYEQYIKKLNDYKALSGGDVSKSESIMGFISAQVRGRTDKQVVSAYTNLITHLKETVAKLNTVSGDEEQLDETSKKYLNVMKDCKLIEQDKNGKYHLVNKPTLNDFLTVSDKYLEIKKALSTYFGDEEYGDAYGS